MQRVYDGFFKVDRDERGYEVVRSTDSVGVLVFQQDAKGGGQVLLISQCRLPMACPENPDGHVVEVPAGRFDVPLGVRALVVKELHEEIGATIDERQVQVLNGGVPLAVSPGMLTERLFLAYVELAPGQLEREERIFGAAHEGERITRRFVPVEELSSLVLHDLKTWALVQWFLREKA